MIALDTNILVYAHAPVAPRHAEAVAALRELAEGPTRFAVPAPVLSEYLRVATHRRSPAGGAAPAPAIAHLDRLLASPAATVLRPGPNFWSILRQLLIDHDLRGEDVFDAQIVATCIEHGVDRILTEDVGFDRFPRFSGVSLEQFLAG